MYCHWGFQYRHPDTSRTKQDRNYHWAYNEVTRQLLGPVLFLPEQIYPTCILLRNRQRLYSFSRSAHCSKKGDFSSTCHLLPTKPSSKLVKVKWAPTTKSSKSSPNILAVWSPWCLWQGAPHSWSARLPAYSSVSHLSHIILLVPQAFLMAHNLSTPDALANE